MLLTLPLLAGLVGMSPALAQSGQQGTTLTWSHPQEPPNWNYWQTGASALSMPTFMNVLQPLLENMGDGTVAPLLAESYEISPDGLVYTFRLRQAKFHDGSDLDAADVVYSLEKNKVSPNATIKTPLAPVEKMEAVDPRTVKLTLSRPSQRLLGELGLTAGVIVPEGLHETTDLAAGMIGTGPYVFGAYRPDIDLTLNRFADYWGEKPYFEKITHRFIPDETAAINALLAGEVDMVATVLGEGLDRMESVVQDARFKALKPAPFETNYVFMSTHKAEFKDIRVRQAIAHAINRDDILAAAQAGYGETTCMMVIPFSEPYNSDYCPYPFDPAKARALLAEAGQSNLEIDFPYITVAEHPLIRELLEAMLSDVGITVKARALDLATWLERVNTNGEYEFSNLTSSARAESYICKGGRQPLGRPDSALCDTEFDEMVSKSDTIVDRAAYIEAMKEMVQHFADSAWVIPIHSKSSPTLTRADLEGFKPYRFRLEMDARKLRWAGK